MNATLWPNGLGWDVGDDAEVWKLKNGLGVRIITDDFLPCISPCHHVIDGALELDSKSSWHARSLRSRVPAVKP